MITPEPRSDRERRALIHAETLWLGRPEWDEWFSVMVAAMILDMTDDELDRLLRLKTWREWRTIAGNQCRPRRRARRIETIDLFGGEENV